MHSTAGTERFDKLYGDIPGSKPDWRGSNIKTKGKAAVTCTPPARLGQTGWAAWTSFQDPKPGFGRRHYHESPLTQTVAKASLPCVDSSIVAAASCSNNLQLSGSLAAAYQEHRRHRRMISTPPEKIRPQGKRMVAKPVSECQDLFKDSEPVTSSTISSCQAEASTATVSHSMQSSSSTLASNIPNVCSLEQLLQHKQQHQQQSKLPECASNWSSTGHHKCSVGYYHSHSTGSSSSSGANVAVAQATTAADRIPAAGDLNSGRTGVPPRVQDNPDYFRTLKDPPAFQRFCASITARSAAKPGGSTAARHEFGLQQKQRAALELAKSEVAALQMPDL